MVKKGRHAGRKCNWCRLLGEVLGLPHSGRLSAGPAMRYGVSNPSYMRCATIPSAACFKLWQWSIQMPGLSATKATS